MSQDPYQPRPAGDPDQPPRYSPPSEGPPQYGQPQDDAPQYGEQPPPQYGGSGSTPGSGSGSVPVSGSAPEHGSAPQYGSPPPAYGQPQFGSEPPQYGSPPPPYGQPQFGSSPPQYGSPPPPYGEPSYGSQPPQYGSGYAGGPAYGYPGAPTAPRNGLGTAALVLGILGVLTFWLLGLGAVLGLVAIILGVIGLRRVRSGQATNRTSAIAGIVLGAIAIALLIFTIGRVLDEFGSEFDNFSDCASAANTQAERDQCVRDFQDQVSR